MRRVIPLAVAAAAAGGAASCGVVEPQRDAGTCRVPAVDTRGWAAAGGSDFTFVVPPALRRVAVQGIDSEVGRWEGAGRVVSYDYGVYSDPLRHAAERPAASVCEGQIGGRRARVVLGRSDDGRYVAAAHWPALGDSPLGTLSLTLSGSAPDSLAREELLATLWSVRFRGR